MRKRWRTLEKKKELLAADWDGLNHKIHVLQQDKFEFQDWVAKVRETSLRLAQDRDQVMQEKDEYEFEKEALEKEKMDLDL